MKQFNFLILLLLSGCLICKGQPINEDWYQGKVFFRNQDTLSSLISYDVVNDVIQVQIGATVRSYTAVAVEGFEFLDEERKQLRCFKAAKFGMYSNDYKVPLFFEVLTRGQGLTLLAKRSHVLVPFTNAPLITRKHYPEVNFSSAEETGGSSQKLPYLYAKDYKYAIKKKRILEALYIMTPDGQVKRYTDDTRIWSTFYVRELTPKYENPDKEALNSLFSDQKAEVRRFVQEHKLNYGKKEDLIKIVEYYNKLNRYAHKHEVKI